MIDQPPDKTPPSRAKTTPSRIEPVPSRAKTAPPPIFSIILPTFNRAQTLPRAIRSVLAQTFSSWELIIVDDGSTDNTRKIVDRFKKDPRITYKKIKKAGVVAARTAGIKHASAPIITFLDSDDYYKPDHLARNLAKLNATPPPDMIHSLTHILGDPYVADVNDLSRKLHIDECCAHGTFFIRREVLDKIMPLPRVSYGEDYHLLQKILSAGYKVVKTADRTYVYDRSGR